MDEQRKALEELTHDEARVLRQLDGSWVRIDVESSEMDALFSLSSRQLIAVRRRPYHGGREYRCTVTENGMQALAIYDALHASDENP